MEPDEVKQAIENGKLVNRRDRRASERVSKKEIIKTRERERLLNSKNLSITMREMENIMSSGNCVAVYKGRGYGSFDNLKRDRDLAVFMESIDTHVIDSEIQKLNNPSS